MRTDRLRTWRRWSGGAPAPRRARGTRSARSGGDRLRPSPTRITCPRHTQHHPPGERRAPPSGVDTGACPLRARCTTRPAPRPDEWLSEAGTRAESARTGAIYHQILFDREDLERATDHACARRSDERRSRRLLFFPNGKMTETSTADIGHRLGIAQACALCCPKPGETSGVQRLVTDRSPLDGCYPVTQRGDSSFSVARRDASQSICDSSYGCVACLAIARTRARDRRRHELAGRDRRDTGAPAASASSAIVRTALMLPFGITRDGGDDVAVRSSSSRRRVSTSPRNVTRAGRARA